jgi:hypothetical protein
MSIRMHYSGVGALQKSVSFRLGGRVAALEKRELIIQKELVISRWLLPSDPYVDLGV